MYIYFMKQADQYTCHSGGAEGADAYFEFFSERFRVKTVAYSYKTRFHRSVNKYELTDCEFNEGRDHVLRANEVLKRSNIQLYLNLLARNWHQVKNADEVFAIVPIQFNNNGFRIKGGSAWAVQMAVNAGKNIFVYDQEQLIWFFWNKSSATFDILKDEPGISSLNFAGIGTRKINLFGIEAIEQLYKNTFKQ